MLQVLGSEEEGDWASYMISARHLLVRVGKTAEGLGSVEEDPRIQTGNTLSAPGNNKSTQFTLCRPVCRARRER